jgi:SNF2 family DNA or RNA helicase
VKLYPHQVAVLDTLKNYNRCLLAMDMGTGKTHTSSEKLRSLDFKHALVVCQKSLVSMWVKHLTDNYPEWTVIDYTKPKVKIPDSKCVIVLNYDIVFRRPELMALKNLSVILDECTIVSNPSARRTKAVFRLDIQNIIMLSGTISKGRYENLWTTLRLLGWNISKRDFYSRYIIEQEINIANTPFPVKIVVGYKNIDELKSMLRKYGSYFLKTEEVITLPEQTFVNIDVPTTPKYRKFRRDGVVEVGHQTLVGSTTLNRMLYERMLCGQYNDEKLTAFTDLLESTDDRLIVFYNFNDELDVLKKVIGNSRPISEVNGHTKDLAAFENEENSITLCQYTAAAKGLNLQKANKIVYFSPTLSCEDWMQSQKRTHRIGQKNSCFYYKLVCKNSIEERIYAALERGVDFTNRLFEEETKQVTNKIK